MQCTSACMRPLNTIDCFYRSKAGISLLKQSKNNDGRLPVLEALHCEFISFWKEPIQATSDSLIRSHQETLMEGQVSEQSILISSNENTI